MSYLIDVATIPKGMNIEAVVSLIRREKFEKLDELKIFYQKFRGEANFGKNVNIPDGEI